MNQFLQRLLLFTFCSFQFLSFSQSNKIEKEIIEINNENDKVNIFENFSFFKEKGNTEFDLERLSNAAFYKPKKLYYLESLKSETFWMRATLKNETAKNFSYYYILKHPYLFNSTVFLVNDNLVKEQHTYNYQKIKKENTYSNYPTWKINLPKNKETTIYVKIYDTRGRTKITSLLKGEKDFLKYSITSFGIHALFGFFILFVILLTLYISIYTKKLFVLFYGLYVVFLSVDYLCVHGIGQSYLWADSIFLVKNARSISNAASGLFLGLFFAYFYDLYSFPKWIKKGFLFLSLIFAVFLCLYIVKYFNGSFITLYKYVWKVISTLTIVVIIVHGYLFYKKAVPLYLPVVFIFHLAVTFINKNVVFPYYNNVFIDWFIFNIAYISLCLEIIVLTYFIFKSLKNEKKQADKLVVEFEILQEELNTFKQKNIKENAFKKGENITLKSKALLNTKDILYIKSDGHYVEYYLENRTNPEIDRNSLNKVAAILPSAVFIRIHKSYIVNIHRIKIINSTKVMLENGVWINLSRTYKQQLKDILHKEG